MNASNSSDIQCSSSSALNVAVDNVVEVLKNHEEEVQNFDVRKQNLEAQVESLKRSVLQLEFEKSEIDAEITTLKLRDLAYQKEHTYLRNAITVVKFQIEKIKESIEKQKSKELRDLEDFEKDVDEITEKFRSGPYIYNRRTLLEKIRTEKEKKDLLLKQIEEVRNSYEDFCRERGLRIREDKSETLLDCVLPGSSLSYLIEMTETLDEVIRGLKTSQELNETT